MKIAEYFEIARSTAIYPDSAKFFYPALGLAGEVGETLDKLHQQLAATPISREALTLELGDILWYVTNTALDIDISPTRRIHNITWDEAEISNFNELKSVLSPITDKRHPQKKLPIYVGRIAEVAKKAIRDSGGEITDAKRAVVADSLENILVCLCELADVFSICMGDVAQGNIDKLLSRQERGVLKGSGDNR